MWPRTEGVEGQGGEGQVWQSLLGHCKDAGIYLEKVASPGNTAVLSDII